MNLLTICIPVAPAHEPLVQRAINSVKAQSIPCNLIVYRDDQQHGAGYARNELLDMVHSPYISFLDADDWLEPNFAETMLQRATYAKRDNRYVYSGWFESKIEGEKQIEPPSKCYCFDNGWRVHLINAVIPTDWAQRCQFDVELKGMEDTDFFHQLHALGYCGEAVNLPLVHYWIEDSNRRSVIFHNMPDMLATKTKIGQRWNRGEAMSCCGQESVPNTGPFNEKQEGDLLVAVQGNSQAIYVGRATQRIYNFVGYGALSWVNEDDVTMDKTRFVVQAPMASIVEGFLSATVKPIHPSEQPLETIAPTNPPTKLTAAQIAAKARTKRG